MRRFAAARTEYGLRVRVIQHKIGDGLGVGEIARHIVEGDDSAFAAVPDHRVDVLLHGLCRDAFKKRPFLAHGHDLAPRIHLAVKKQGGGLFQPADRLVFRPVKPVDHLVRA